MNYSEFLFNKLLCESSYWFSKLEYDTQFDRNKAEYDDFAKSKYNVDTKGEYECILDYIDNELLKDRLYTLAFIRENVVRDEDVFYLTGLEYGKVNLNEFAQNCTFTITGEQQLEFNLNN